MPRCLPTLAGPRLALRPPPPTALESSSDLTPSIDSHSLNNSHAHTLTRAHTLTTLFLPSQCAKQSLWSGFFFSPSFPSPPSPSFLRPSPSPLPNTTNTITGSLRSLLKATNRPNLTVLLLWARKARNKSSILPCPLVPSFQGGGA